MAKKKSFLEDVLDEFGEYVTIRKHEDGIPVISSGSLAIDVSTGVGGFPRSRLTEIYGPEASGKTTVLLNVAKEAIKRNLKTVYIDTENSLDYSYVSDVVGDFNEDQLIVLQPHSAEDALELADRTINAGFKCVLFDSMAALSPQKELDKDMTKEFIGLSPRLVSKFLRKTLFDIRTNEVAFIYANQIRDNVGSFFGGWVTPAGHALKHYTSIRIQLTKSESIEQDNEIIGNFVNFVIKKNKVGKPYRQATTNIIYGKGIDYYRDVISFGSLLGVIKNRGSYFGFEGETIGNKPGYANTAEALENDPELLDKIVEMCYNVAGSNRPIFEIDEPEEENNEQGNSN